MRSNKIHESKADPDAHLARKGKGEEAQLNHKGNLLVECRKGMIVNGELLKANGWAEHEAYASDQMHGWHFCGPRCGTDTGVQLLPKRLRFVPDTPMQSN